MIERLDKVLAHDGFGTRREVKKLIHVGKVVVNENIVRDESFKVDLNTDAVFVDGKKLVFAQFAYVMMNKPVGYVCANRDGLHETVFSLLDKKYRTPFFESNLHLVGRLDRDTEGLLIFTTDGALTHYVTSPRTHVGKTYFVKLAQKVDKKMQFTYATRFAGGIHILPERNERAHACKPAVLMWRDKTTDETDECELIIYEGKFHQVKRMFAALGNEVIYLKRIAIGGLLLDVSLALGQCRELTEEEIAVVKEIEAPAEYARYVACSW
ncbi:MAG: rRNA pseudouridine synthase [Treponema sp.]|nr:rRNA pseudouridine synthase [Treponema sp.]